MNRRDFLRGVAVVGPAAGLPAVCTEDYSKWRGIYVVRGSVNRAYVRGKSKNGPVVSQCPIDVRYGEPENEPLYISVLGVAFDREPGTGEVLLAANVFGYYEKLVEPILFMVHPSELVGLETRRRLGQIGRGKRLRRNPDCDHNDHEHCPECGRCFGCGKTHYDRLREAKK
jgi:hypothetical protein